ncbi:hypothetical protein ACFL28_01155 [Candidatus Omnitrophota bacterium]
MRDYEVKLRIADVIIQMKSCFPIEKFTKKEERDLQRSERFNNFSYKGGQAPHIVIQVEIVNRLPNISNMKPVFTTYHFQDRSENWHLLKKGNIYIYKSPIKDKEQLMVVNKTFNRVTAYLLPKNKDVALSEKKRENIKKNKGFIWSVSDVIYDFLQVLLINYFAQRNEGIFTHAIGIRDLGRQGLLFAGKSGCGKTTMAKLWYKHSKTMVLNDDRVIVRKYKKRFFIHGSPWHGEFNDYLASRIESAPLEKLFFIHHALKNIARPVSEKRAFNLLYPALFPTFWDKGGLENIVSFCQDLVKNVPCFSFGFVNDKKIVGFVRKANRGEVKNVKKAKI